MAAFRSACSIPQIALLSRFVAEGQYAQRRAGTHAGFQVDEDVIVLGVE